MLTKFAEVLLIIFFTLVGLPDPALKILLYTFLFSTHLKTKLTKSLIYKKSLICLPSEHKNLLLFKQLIIVFGINRSLV